MKILEKMERREKEEKERKGKGKEAIVGKGMGRETTGQEEEGRKRREGMEREKLNKIKAKIKEGKGRKNN